MPSRETIKTFVKDAAEKLVVLAVIAYIGVSVGRSVMKNYEINKQIADLEEQIVELREQEQYLRNLIAYYKTDTFKELRAREELGFKLPGETVVSVPVDSEDVPLGGARQFAPKKEEKKIIPNYQKWYQYFFS